MPGLKEIKIRIRSIQSMRRTTRAMQLVSAAKMRKAQDATVKSRTYSSLAWELILNLSSVSEMRSGLMVQYPQAQKVAMLALSSNRGLVGSLNTNLMNVAQKTAKQYTDQGLEVDFITYGRKGKEWVMRSGKEVLADFEKFDRSISTEDIYPIAELVSTTYKSGKYQKIVIVYNHFVSTLVQQPRVKQVLPFPVRQNPDLAMTKENYFTEYLFEPTPKAVINHLLPRIIESQIYQAILESEASEQSARMVMMKNATEAAGDLVSDLTLTYNKLRQNKITTELSEITAGRIALE